jgi:hypothetical protein
LTGSSLGVSEIKSGLLSDSIIRDVLAGGTRGSLFSCNPLRNPHAFHMALMGAVVIGIIATVNSTSDNADDVSTGHNLRKVSTIIFLGLTFLQAVQTVWFFRDTTGCESSFIHGS